MHSLAEGLEPLNHLSPIWSLFSQRPFETCARNLLRNCPRDRNRCEAGPTNDALLFDLPQQDGCVATERHTAPGVIDCWDAEALAKAWETAGVDTPDNPAAPGSWQGIAGCARANQRSRVQWQQLPTTAVNSPRVVGTPERAPVTLSRFHEEMQTALARGTSEYERWLLRRHETVLTFAPLSQRSAKALVDMVNSTYIRLRGEQGLVDILQTLERPGFRSRTGLQTRVLFKLCALRALDLVRFFFQRTPRYQPPYSNVGIQCMTYMMSGAHFDTGPINDEAAAALCAYLIEMLPNDAFLADAIELLSREMLAWHLYRTAAVLVALPQTPKALHEMFCRTLSSGHPVGVVSCSALAKRPEGTGHWTTARLRNIFRTPR